MTGDKLRIALFFSSNPTSTGGVQEHILFLSQELRNLGHTVTIFGPEGKSDQYESYISVGNTIQVPLPNGNWASVQIGNAFSDISKMITPQKFDILHIHEPYIPFLAWEINEKVALPKVATFHSAWDNTSSLSTLSSFIPLFKDAFSKKIQAAIFVSKITEKRWGGLCSPSVSKHIIYNAVDHRHFFATDPKSKGKITLLFLGRIVKRKGIHYLLQAFKHLLQDTDNIELNIVGGGAEVENTRTFIKKNGLGKYVHYRGEIFGLNRVRYFQNADIFCAPYFDEASPLTIIEAMSCGCTIVGFENESVKESLAGYPDRSLLVEQRNIKALTEALKKAVQNKNIRKKIRSWCIAESNKYSWNKVARETEKVYLKVLKNYHA